MDPVLTKRQNFALWSSGAFGNKLRCWHPFDAWARSDFEGLVVLRELNPLGGGGRCVYDLRPDEAYWCAAQWEACGVPHESIMVNEAMPAHRVIVQGELWTGGDREGYFLHSYARLHMRPALADQQWVTTGLATRLLLRRHMTEASYADLEVLIEQYPSHAIELTVCSGQVGDTPGRNTLVWEVRRY